jgi:hypothetical protein
MESLGTLFFADGLAAVIRMHRASVIPAVIGLSLLNKDDGDVVRFALSVGMLDQLLANCFGWGVGLKGGVDLLFCVDFIKTVGAGGKAVAGCDGKAQLIDAEVFLGRRSVLGYAGSLVALACVQFLQLAR